MKVNNVLSFGEVASYRKERDQAEKDSISQQVKNGWKDALPSVNYRPLIVKHKILKYNQAVKFFNKKGTRTGNGEWGAFRDIQQSKLVKLIRTKFKLDAKPNYSDYMTRLIRIDVPENMKFDDNLIGEEVITTVLNQWRLVTQENEKFYVAFPVPNSLVQQVCIWTGDPETVNSQQLENIDKVTHQRLLAADRFATQLKTKLPGIGSKDWIS